MKILMVNKFLYPVGGAENYMFQLGEYLEKKGHRVEYFGMYHPDNIVGNQWNSYSAPMDFHRKGMLSNMVNPLKLIYSKDAEKKIKAILSEFQPDILHINNFNYQLTPSILVAAEDYRTMMPNKMRIVYTAHDSQLVCPNHYLYNPTLHQVCIECLSGGYGGCIRKKCIHGSLLRSCLGVAEAMYWKRRKIYKTIDAIICPSTFMKSVLDTEPLLASRTMFLRNFSRPVRGTKQKKGRYILYFGRYSEEKGIRMLLNVCRELEDISFVFAGGGPLEHLIDGMKNVKNLGFLRGRELDEVIGEARFTICSSECNENCPFSVMESITNGRPVLGAKRGGIPELIREGKTGWLYQAGDQENLSKMIRRIWESDEPERFSVFCEEKEFDTIEEYGRKLMKIYRPC